ncbi:MAG: hypothetical protein GXZ06_04090 [Tissierellia bacterium]|nr:hypothetical protein [Tissierellia bacterium]
MNKILLINRLNPDDISEEKHKIFFMIGDMKNPETEDRLIDVLHNSNLIEPQDLVLKYNGVELYIAIKHIPVIIKLLCDNGFLIYGVYHPYNPEG